MIPEHRDLILAWSQAGVSNCEQARRLGCTVDAVKHARRRLRAEGALAPSRPATGRPWTEIDVWRLRDMIDQGHSYDAIARRLQRSRIAVVNKARRIDYRHCDSRNTLNARQIARLLGLGCEKTVRRWIARHELPARRAGRGGRTMYQVQWDDLLVWLEDERHWMAYDPTACTDPLLREHLIEIREGRPQWVPLGAVATRFHVAINTVNLWIHEGRLPALRYGNWWIRETDLAAFVIPAERSRRAA